MGCKCCKPYLGDDVVGAYEYNVCNCCCPSAKLWTAGGCDGQEFDDPEWAPTKTLRRDFERELESESMHRVLEEAPRGCACCFGGCMTVDNLAPALNEHWCPAINEKLLHPRGYTCDAYFWITYGDKGQRQEHMVIRVRRRAAAGGDGD